MPEKREGHTKYNEAHLNTHKLLVDASQDVFFKYFLAENP